MRQKYMYGPFHADRFSQACCIGPIKKKKRLRKIVIFFLFISLNILGFGCSKEPSHRDGSFEYTQHMFWMRK